MDPIPYAQIATGTFLIATPEIDSGLFHRAVILVCEHTPNGSFGLIINKALDLELPEDIIDVNNVENPHIQLRAGGPVQTNQMMLLHSCNDIPEQTLEVCHGVNLGGDLQFLQTVIGDREGPKVHLCFGYTGWGAGQLEREYLDGQWLLHPANKEHIFEYPVESMWQMLLREMGGKYATLSMIPEDLSLN